MRRWGGGGQNDLIHFMIRDGGGRAKPQREALPWHVGAIVFAIFVFSDLGVHYSMKNGLIG